MLSFLRLAHSYGGEASFKYRDKVEKWKDTGRKLALYRTKGINKLARGNSSKWKIREMGKTEQGGLKSHISFRIWKKIQYSSANICQIDWQNSILLEKLVPLGCVYTHGLLGGRGPRSSPLTAHQRAESQSCLHFQRKPIKPSPLLSTLPKNPTKTNSTWGASQIHSDPSWGVKGPYQWPVLWISQFPCAWWEQSVQSHLR